MSGIANEEDPMMVIVPVDMPHGDPALAMNAEGAYRLYKALDSILRGALPGRRSIRLLPPDGEWFDLHITVQAAEHLPEQKYEWDYGKERP